MKYSQTIYLGADDDIALVIDKIIEAETPEVVLVIPANAEIFGSIVNLKLLRREAENLNKHLVIATADKVGRYLVERAGIELEKILTDNEAREKTIQKTSRLEKQFKIQNEVQAPTEKRQDKIEAKQEQTGLAKQFSSPRIMADIIIPIRKIEPKKIEEKIVTNVFEERESEIEEKRQENIIAVPDIDSAPSYVKEEEFEPEADKISEPLSVESFWTNSAPSEKDFPLTHFEPIAEPLSSERDYSPVLQTKKEKRGFWRLGNIRGTKKFAYIFAAIGLVVFATAAYLILPKAKLVITAKKQASAFNLLVIADKNLTKVDYSLKRIPAQLVKVEKKETQEFLATGTSEGSQKARGIITVYNNYSESSQGLVATTRFIDKNSGKLFRTTKNITVPGAKTENGKLVPGTIDVEVIADQAGATYNIGPAEFSIPGFQGTPKYVGFYGKSRAAMSGGAEGKAKVVSNEDLESAKKALNETLKIKASDILKEQISSNLKLFDNAFKQGEPEIVFSANVNDVTEKFTGTIKVQIIALVFDPKNISDLASKNSGSSAFATIDYISWKTDFEKGIISIETKISQEGAGKIDIANLKVKLAGKNEADIRKILSQISEVQSAKITLWPFWVKTMPPQAEKIQIEIEQGVDEK